MSRIIHHGHGVYCYVCQSVYEDQDGCEHGFDNKDGVNKRFNGDYETDVAGMGHETPCVFHTVDGVERCVECGKAKLPEKLVNNPISTDGNEK